MDDDYKKQLVAHPETVVRLAERAETESATQQYLIIPFFRLLGYDPYNPDEIVPEAHASFSDKFRNRVDYAIYKDKEPVIAVESKKVGSLSEANKGELKGYFNAMPSVKLGILTDGLTYQLFSDTNRENMMDDQPFVVVDLVEAAQERIPDNAFDALLKLRKNTFDPASVGKDAQRKLYVSAYLTVLEQVFKQPQKEVVRALMDLAGVEGNKTSKLVEEHTLVVAEAMRIFFDKKLLERVGFADRKDLIRVPETESGTEPDIEERPVEVQNLEPTERARASIVTTETEQQVFDYVKRRLSFLIDRDEDLFEKLDYIFMRDRKTILNVSYKLEQKGKLFGFREGGESKYRFESAGSGTQINTDNFSEIDDELLAAFLERVEELG